MRRAARIIGKIVGWTLLSVLLLVVSVLLTVVIVGRTNWGHRKILAVALPQIQKALAGHLAIGSMDGDLVHGLILNDVEVDDVEHEPVAKLKRIEVHYNLLALTRHEISLTKVKADDAWVHIRTLKDGRLNVATIAKPSTDPPKPSDPDAKPYHIKLGDVAIDLDARYDDSTAAPPYDHIWAKAHLEADADINGDAYAGTLKKLTIDTTRPLVASVKGEGGAKMDGGAISADKLKITVDAAGNQLRRLAPGVKLRGQWQVMVTGDGPADRLALAVRAKPPAGSLDVDAKLATQGKSFSIDTLAWQLAVAARGIDPAEAVTGLPKGDVRIDASGKGKGTQGNIDLKGLAAAVAGMTVDAHGAFSLAGNGNVEAKVKAHDLAQLRAVGLRGYAGAVKADVKAEKRGAAVDVDLDAVGVKLALAGNRIGRLEAHVHEKSFTGEAHIGAVGIAASGIRLDSLKLDAQGTTEQLKLALTARGPDQESVDLNVHGTPETKGRGRNLTVTGADLVIDKLALQHRNEKWATTKPATVKVHGGVQLAGFELASGPQKLAIDARYAFADGRLGAKVKARALDVRELAMMAKPSLDLPHTKLDLDVDARGTSKRPEADVTLKGDVEPSPRLKIDRVDTELALHYGDDRAKGSVKVSSVGQSLQAKIDMPVVLKGERPMALDLEIAHVKLAKLARLLPPSFKELDGGFDASLKLNGTPERPALALDAHATKVMLGQQSQNNDLHLAVGYKERKLDGKVDVELQKRMLNDDGKVQVAIAVPIALTIPLLQKSGALVKELEDRIPLSAKVTVEHLDMARFPFAALGMVAPLRAGKIEGKVDLEGTMRQPTFVADIQGHGLAQGKIDKVELKAHAGYADQKAQANVDVSLRGSKLLALNAHAPIDIADVLAGKSIKSTPIFADAEVPKFDLSKIQDLAPNSAGQLELAAKVRGTLAKIEAKVDANINGFKLDQMAYSKFEIHGSYDGQKAVAKVDARETQGGTLAVDATVPLVGSNDIDATVRANKFFVDIANENLTNPRLLKGTLDIAIDAHGPRTSPTLKGSIKMADGQLALADDPRLFQKIKVDVGIAPGRITLNNAEAHLLDGNVVANGYVTLKGLSPQNVELKAYARHLPVTPGSFGTWVDADIVVAGNATPEGMKGSITIAKGTARLPELANVAGRKLQSTDPLPDVKFVDPEALRRQAKKAADEAKSAQKDTAVQLIAKIPGPFHVRSPELSTDLKGTIYVNVAGQVARLGGRVETEGGWISLLGRHYDIDKARVGFDGGAVPNPELDIRLTRQLSEAMIIIEVHGTAKKPQLVLSSDPPIYDQAEVISAILSGDPATQQADTRSMDQKVTGAISGLVVGKIKDQIAPNLPIDVIKVDTGSEGATGAEDTRIEVGKFITDTIYVSYVHQFGATTIGTIHQNSNEADVEWRFKKHYELDTAFGDAAVGRVNVYWTIRY